MTQQTRRVEKVTYINETGVMCDWSGCSEWAPIYGEEGYALPTGWITRSVYFFDARREKAADTRHFCRVEHERAWLEQQ